MTSLFSCRTPVISMSMVTALALSACQPVTQETTLTQDVVTVESDPVAVDTEMKVQADHDMASEDMMAEDAMQMTDMLKEYTKSITRMRDEMMIGMNYNDPDVAFAKGLLGHHRGALDMANLELKYGTDASMRQLAQEVIDTQQIEIDTMRKWLASHLDAPNPKPETQAMQQAYSSGMEAMYGEMMLGIADPIADVAFAHGMLPHHIGAVDMAKIQLKYGNDQEMLALAQQIIDNQQPEIELMQGWIAIQPSSEASIPDGLATTDSTDSVKAIKPTA